MIMEMILEAASRSMIPRQLFRSRRSPFFGTSFNRMVPNSWSRAATVSVTGAVGSPASPSVASPAIASPSAASPTAGVGAVWSESGKIWRYPLCRSWFMSAALALRASASACVVAGQYAAYRRKDFPRFGFSGIHWHRQPCAFAPAMRSLFDSAARDRCCSGS